MRKWITFLMTFLVGSVSHANALVNGSQLNFEAGYRRDSIGWSAQVPACDPIFKSSSRFKDIDIFQLGLHGRTNLGCNVYLRGAFSWGWILDGDLDEKFELFTSPLASVSEVDIDAVTATTRSDNVLDGRFVLDFSVALGYPFYFCDCTMAVAPVIGYSFDEQNLRIDSGENFDLTHVDGVLVPFQGSGCCDDKFISRWYGPFIGVDFVYRPCGDCWSLYAELEYHFARHKAKRHAGHGGEFFDAFDSTARHAHGWVFGAGADYDFNGCWTVGLSVKVQDWGATRRHRECDDGSDFSEIFSCNPRVKSHVDWHSFAINLTLGREF